MTTIETAKVPSARRRQIIEYLAQNGAASVGQLAGALGVSLATVHRDLRILESEELLHRVQGGATAIEMPSAAVDEGIESSFVRRVQKQGRAKLAVGVRAAELIQRGQTVFLDASTTSLALAAAIEASGMAVTLVTTSPAIAQTLTAPAVRVVMVPGQVDQELRIVTGSWANEFLSTLNFASAFVSCAGIGEDGSLFTESREIQVTLQRALSRASRKVCLLDASKVGRTASLMLCSADELDTMVLDSELPSEEAERISAHGVEIVTGSYALPEALSESAIYRTYFA
jgi:DeoR/GlpR family transcriptional regulator of sugar metabolism